MAEVLAALGFGLGFMQRALLAGVIAAAVSAVIGTFLVLRRLSLIADGLGHISFAGLALGLLLRGQPLVAAVAVVVLAALGIERLRGTRQAAGDVAVALYSSLGLAGGIVLARLAGGVNVDLFGYLFGSLVAVTPQDVGLIAGLGAAVLAVVAVLYHDLVAVTVDEDAAAAAGLPVGALNYLLVTLTALTVLAAVRVVGVLLATALMVIPVAAGLRLCRGFLRAILASAGVGVFSVVAGLALAYRLDLPAGAAIVLTAAGCFTAASLAAGWRARCR